MVSQSPAKASNLISCACSIHAGSEGPVTRDYKAGCRNKCSGRRTEIPVKLTYLCVGGVRTMGKTLIVGFWERLS